jgi:hypothetical protein
LSRRNNVSAAFGVKKGDGRLFQGHGRRLRP